MLKIKKQYLGRRISFVSSNQKESFNIILSGNTPQKAIKELQKKYPHWVEQKKTDDEETESKNKKPKK